MPTRSIRIVSLAAALCAVGAAQSPCSIETIRGTWATASEGFIIMQVPGRTEPVPAPAAMIGMVTIDAQGKMSGWQNAMVAGQFMDGTAPGSVEVKPDCTGTMRFQVQPLGGAPLPGEGVSRFVILDGGNLMQVITVKGLMGSPVGPEMWRRVVRNSKDAPTCSMRSLAMPYASVYNGMLLMTLPGQQQETAVPVHSVGAGIGSSFAVGGQVTDFDMVDVSAEVFEDCSGITRFKLKPKGSPAALPREGIEKTIFLDGGREAISLTIQGVLGKPAVIGRWWHIDTNMAPQW